MGLQTEIDSEAIVFTIKEYMANGECPLEVYEKRITDLSNYLIKLMREVVEGAELTDEDMDAIKLDKNEYRKLRGRMDNYQPQEFRGLFFRDESRKIIHRKVAEAQLQKVKEAMED